MSMRDDFPRAVKETLAKRVAYRCSNPNCQVVTSGPNTDPTKVINVGVAAHITAAATDGPRYDPTQTSEHRRSIHNGIWLCQRCAKLIDNDVRQFSVQTLMDWKFRAEAAAATNLL